MGLDSIWHWLILLVIVLAVFGTGKLTRVGPDLGRAVREFKNALHGGNDTDSQTDTDKDAEYLKADPPPGQPHSETASQEHHASDHSK